jgi:steroid delta-isomerase-like uncharacterized protein
LEDLANPKIGLTLIPNQLYQGNFKVIITSTAYKFKTLKQQMNNETILREFMQNIWNEKNFANISKFLADEYTIHIDNADPWEGNTLNQSEFETRLNYTFNSFPDIYFDIKTAVSDGNLVAITWVMTGTNTGQIGDLPATNKKIEANGATIYHFVDGKICGHTQVYDRTTIMKQLGFM